MVKGIDQKFVHYGIRTEDLALIENICNSDGIDFNWLCEEILKKYHANRVEEIEVSDEETEKIISDAIMKIKQ